MWIPNVLKPNEISGGSNNSKLLKIVTVQADRAFGSFTDRVSDRGLAADAIYQYLFHDIIYYGTYVF